MAKPPPSAAASAAGGRGQAHHRTRFLLLILVAVAASASTAGYLLRGAPVAPCDAQGDPSVLATARVGGAAASPLGFMKSKLVLLVSHELSLSGGPLLLMELAFLLRQVGSQVVWITNQRPEGTNYASYGLEHKMLNHGVQILPARGQEALDTALKADLVILNTAVAGKWLDAVLKDHVPQVLPKILWWIHEMRGHYFKLEYVKHLPLVAGAMIDSHTTAEYWKNRTHDRLNIQMPQTYVVHLGNSKELTEVAEDNVARRVLHEHIRESLGVRSEDLLFAIINSVSRGKGQDLFLQAFYQSLQLIQHQKLKVPRMHAVVVGSDMNAQTKFETQLHEFVAKNGIQDRVHFINKTLAVAPYLSAIDVLVQNSQARGECFGRITIEAMAFKLPVLAIFSSLSLRVCVCTWHGRWRDHRNCFGWLNWPSAPCWEGGRHASREEHGKACEPCRGEGLHGEQGLCQSEGEVHGTPHGRPYRRGVEGSSAEIAAAFPFLSFVTARIQWHRCVDISCASMLIRILARLNPNTESTVRSLLPVPLTSVVIRGCCLLT